MLEEKAAVAAWKDSPARNIVTTQDLNIPVAVQRFMARRARAIEVAASHSVAVSHPRLVADVREKAARATR